jgi:hypothetical protein
MLYVTKIGRLEAAQNYNRLLTDTAGHSIEQFGLNSSQMFGICC